MRALRVLADLLELENDEVPQHPGLQQENGSQASNAESWRVEVALFPVNVVHAQVGETEPEDEYRQNGGCETRQNEQDVVDLEATYKQSIIIDNYKIFHILEFHNPNINLYTFLIFLNFLIQFHI